MIPIEECIERGVYRIRSRNLTIGVYDGDGAFIGLREKFGDQYLFAEYHVDQGAPFGTVHPEEFICMLPEGLLCKVSWPGLWATNPETKKFEEVERRALEQGEAQHGKRISFVDRWKGTGERLPDNLYPFTQENQPLFDYLKQLQSETKTT